MNAGFAFVRQTGFSNTRLSVSRRDEQLPGTRKFRRAEQSMPRLDFQTSPFEIKPVPVLNSFTGYFNNSRRGEESIFSKSAGGRWNIYQTVPLAARTSFTPSVFYDENVYFSTITAGQISRRDAWIGRYGTGANIRYDIGPGTLDLGHLYTRRMRVNMMKPDNQAYDKGEEKNLLTFENLMRPDRRIYTKLASGYDLRVSRMSGERFRDKMEPVTGEIGYTPRPSLNAFVRDEYDLRSGNSAFITQADMGDRDADYAGIGFAHYSSAKSDYIFNQSAGWRPRNASWRIEAALRWLAEAPEGMHIKTLRIFGKSIVFYKDFHDFRTRWNFNVRPGVKEFTFKIDLKMSAKEKLLNRESDRYWYPWREQGQERD